jgi:hypothetical protein
MTTSMTFNGTVYRKSDKWFDENETVYFTSITAVLALVTNKLTIKKLRDGDLIFIGTYMDIDGELFFTPTIKRKVTPR